MKKWLYSLLVWFWWSVLGLGTLGLVGGFLLIRYDVSEWFGPLPSFEKFENPTIEHASVLISADSVVLGKYYRENRTLSTYESLSEPLRETLLVTEDVRFFDHAGIDLRSLLRASLGVMTFEYAGGGSTLTMQLAENLYRTATENKGTLYQNRMLGQIITKCKEWIIAVQLEKNFTKKEIMAMYLNTIPFGSNAYGIAAAANTFFSKTPDELDYHEAALLVGLINAPTRYSPVSAAAASLEKRNQILYNLYLHDRLDQAAYAHYRALPLSLNYKVEAHYRGVATYFRSVLKNYLIKWAAAHGYDLFGDGLRIHITLDSRIQAHAEAALKSKMKQLQSTFFRHWGKKNPWVDEENKEIPNFLSNAITRTQNYKALYAAYEGDSTKIDSVLRIKRNMRLFTWTGEQDTLFSYYDSLAYYKRFLNSGLMAVEPSTGHVRAWVGGINYKYFKYDHVMQSKRQPGSTIKPFVYTAVIDNGYTPCHTVLDNPVTFHLPSQYPDTWTPSNADGAPSGRQMTLRQAMARSVNSITAYWMKKLGPNMIVDYAHRLGIESRIDAVPALCLGAGGDVSIFEMVGAYSTFVNLGVKTKPTFITRIEDKHGNLLQDFSTKRIEALSEQTAYTMLHMLKGTLEERGGTAVRIPYTIRGQNEVGAKTGTTQNASDGWFIGLTHNLVTGVWVGGEDRSIHFRNWTMGQGAKTAMPIWIDFMERLYADPISPLPKGYFKKPRTPLSISLECNEYQQRRPNPTTEQIF